MLESTVGRIDPATRQNAGSLGKFVPSGAVYDPGGTESAVVMVVSAKERFASPSQVDAPGERPMARKTTKRTRHPVIPAVSLSPSHLHNALGPGLLKRVRCRVIGTNRATRACRH